MRCLVLLGAVVLTARAATRLEAQSAAGRVTGTVTAETGEAIAGGNLRQVARHMDLRKAALRREDEHALRRLAEGE